MATVGSRGKQVCGSLGGRSGRQEYDGMKRHRLRHYQMPSFVLASSPLVSSFLQVGMMS